eukprot:CAMPEP_0168313296 /NCGR_PEP_ID=MMETSP0210-20121227/1023_1 /TAXON_ID=40633 /ORGANISM="Condylostoma magnum, Strain COL2" /LENGTH=71 /DNA_ID=CAMNT_0008268159 /DNA_START=662 /DNA_END=877 /DNA_ORIENTATION=+
MEGDIGVIQGLLQAGIDINVLDQDGYSPMALALKEDNIQAARILLESGADPNIGGSIVGSALHMAAYRAEP